MIEIYFSIKWWGNNFIDTFCSKLPIADHRSDPIAFRIKRPKYHLFEAYGLGRPLIITCLGALLKNNFNPNPKGGPSASGGTVGQNLLPRGRLRSCRWPGLGVSWSSGPVRALKQSQTSVWTSLYKISKQPVDFFQKHTEVLRSRRHLNRNL